jgi:hypothetical protein
VSLEHLDLSNNNLLTASCLEEILNHCQAHQIPLKRLNLGSCPSLWDNTSNIAPERILLPLEAKLRSERQFTYLRITTDGPVSYDGEDDAPLSSMEKKMSALWEEYAGVGKTSLLTKDACSTTFHYE